MHKSLEKPMIAIRLPTDLKSIAEDGLALFESNDLLAIGALANVVRERINGNKTFYNVNRHMNYTNVCVSDCGFCSFYRRVRDPEAYEWSVAECIELRARHTMRAHAKFTSSGACTLGFSSIITRRFSAN
jgi:2-iminoacetate synthase ThiH